MSILRGWGDERDVSKLVFPPGLEEFFFTAEQARERYPRESPRLGDGMWFGMKATYQITEWPEDSINRYYDFMVNLASADAGEARVIASLAIVGWKEARAAAAEGGMWAPEPCDSQLRLWAEYGGINPRGMTE